MEDEDRAFLLSRTGTPGGSMEQLINMVREGNSMQPWKQSELAESSSNVLQPIK